MFSIQTVSYLSDWYSLFLHHVPMWMTFPCVGNSFPVSLRPEPHASQNFDNFTAVNMVPSWLLLQNGMV